MDMLTEADAKRIAMQKAIANGHDMRPWRRDRSAHFYNRSSCRRCRAELLVISKEIDPDQAERMKRDGVTIGEFAGMRSLPKGNYTYASGGALLRCSRA